MRKITLLLAFLLTVSFGHAQSLPIDFDDALDANFAPKGNNTFEVVTDGTNKVGQTTSGDAEWDTRVDLELDTYIDMTTASKTFTFEFYTSEAVVMNGLFQLGNKEAGGDNVFPIEMTFSTDGNIGWETITLDFTNATNGYPNAGVAVEYGQYAQVSIFTNFGDTGSSTYKFDDIAGAVNGAVVPEDAPDALTVPAPTPTNNSSDVKSVYSDAYTSVATNLNPGWGQGTVMTEIEISGNNTMKYTNLDYQGLEYTTSNVSSMEYIHLDYYTEDATEFEFFLIAGGENSYNIAANEGITTGQWVSIDIELSTAYPDRDLKNAFQFKTVGNGTIYLDNIYFWKSASNPLTDVTLSDLQVDGTIISGFGPETTDYEHALSPGTTAIPQITTATPSNTNVTSTTINQATALPGDATVVIVSEDGTVTGTYTVSFIFEGPDTAAPAPPARNSTDVYSMFSGSYTDIPSVNWNPGWSGGISTITTVEVEGDEVFKIVLGADSYFAADANATTHMDLSDFEFMHFDYWTEDASVGQVLNPKLSQWDGGEGEVAGYAYTLPIGTTSGQWVSIDIALTEFLNPTTGLYDVAQVIFQCNTSVLYLDNIYFYKGTILGAVDFEIEGLRAYPNPANSEWVISTKDQIINSIEVFNVLGERVISLQPNALSVKVDASSLASGMYFSTITTESGTVSKKLIKN